MTRSKQFTLSLRPNHLILGLFVYALLLGGAGYMTLADAQHAQTKLTVAEGEDQWRLLALPEQKHSCVTTEQEQAIRRKIAEHEARMNLPVTSAQATPSTVPVLPASRSGRAGPLHQQLR